MSWAAMALGIRLTGVVDRIESDIAVVCWDAEHQSLLPVGGHRRLQEGSGLIVRIRPARRGALAGTSRSLTTPLGHLGLPPGSVLQPGQTYRIHMRIRWMRPPRRRLAASLPNRIDLAADGAFPPSKRSIP